jgi:ferredoxin
MIVAERKPMDQILEMIKPYKRVLVFGCGGCVTICLTGGAREAGILASLVRLKNRETGAVQDVAEKTVERQCEWEFLDEAKPEIAQAEAVLSLACGVGVQALAQHFPEKVVLPAMNTTFLGMPVEQGKWQERCGACGDCVLHLTGGVCPIIRCSKSLLNGPCGGSQNGKCEIDKELDCGWQLIHDRLQKLGRPDLLETILPPKDWSKSRDGGPRKMTREDMLL